MIQPLQITESIYTSIVKELITQIKNNTQLDFKKSQLTKIEDTWLKKLRDSQVYSTYNNNDARMKSQNSKFDQKTYQIANLPNQKQQSMIQDNLQIIETNFPINQLQMQSQKSQQQQNDLKDNISQNMIQQLNQTISNNNENQQIPQAEIIPETQIDQTKQEEKPLQTATQPSFQYQILPINDKGALERGISEKSTAKQTHATENKLHRKQSQKSTTPIDMYLSQSSSKEDLGQSSSDSDAEAQKEYDPNKSKKVKLDDGSDNDKSKSEPEQEKKSEDSGQDISLHSIDDDDSSFQNQQSVKEDIQDCITGTLQERPTPKKQRSKIILRNVIAHLSGKDYIFSSLTGDARFNDK